MTALRIGSVCSGYEGLGIAVEQVLGGEKAWFFENDKAPSKILKYHWPEVTNHHDLLNADWAAIEPVDVMHGGTPCQDLSGAGKRRGMVEGSRSNLWVAMREGIAVQRPKIVIWENVRGAYSAYAASEVESEPGLLGEYGPDRPALRGLGRVLGDLSELGYDARWAGVRASDVGAPHNRFRVFVAATLRHTGHGTGSPEFGVQPEITNRGFGEPSKNASDTVGFGSEGNWASGTQHSPVERASSDVPNAGSGRGDEGINPPVFGTESADGSGVVDERGPRSSGVEWGDYLPAIERWERILGRRAPNPTIGDGRDGGHRLSAVFVEWLMGAESGHVTSRAIGLTRNEQLKALGNGVVSQQAAYAIANLL